jgi:tripartite-type tricarboxylate transporter receptor subunit TctC
MSSSAVRIASRASALLLAATMAQGAAQGPPDTDANSFPTRPIRIIVPFPAGGPADIIARLVAQRMSEHWGQAAVVENRPGANTAIGAQAVAKSPPDGHTLLAGMDTTMVMNPLLIGNLAYDPAKDFAPITLLTRNMSLLVVRSDGPTTARELIATARANPGKLNMGAGTITSRLGALAFVKAAGIDVVLIPYKGSAEIVHGLLSGSVDFALDSSASSLPQIQGGRFRALAKYSNRPLTALPDLPSLAAAADLPSLDESSTWIGLLAPAGTPDAIIDKIQREVAGIYAEAAMMERLEKAGLFAVSSTPAEFRAFIRAETERWSKVIKDNPQVRLD